MVTWRAVLFAIVFAFTSILVRAQSVVDTTGDDFDEDEDSLVVASPFDTHFSIGLAFTVGAVMAQDIVAIINQELGDGTVSKFGFGGAAGFTSAFTWRALDFYDVSFSQAFLTRAYEFGDAYSGVSSYGYDLHEFALFVHRVYLDDEYSFSYGMGGGMVMGSYRSSLRSSPQEYHATVTGGMVGVEAILRTAFGGHLFLHTELHAAMTFTGAMKDALGNAVFIQASARNAGLGAFSGSVSVGMDYCF